MRGHPRRARLSARARRCALRCRRCVAVEQPLRGCISCGIAWRWHGVARRCRGGSGRRSGGCNHVAASLDRLAIRRSTGWRSVARPAGDPSLDRLAIRRSTGWRYGGRTGGDTLVDPATIGCVDPAARSTVSLARGKQSLKGLHLLRARCRRKKFFCPPLGGTRSAENELFSARRRKPCYDFSVGRASRPAAGKKTSGGRKP